MDMAVFSVVYPGVESYIPEFLCSLSKQTDKGFSLFLVNDCVADIKKLLKEADFNVEVIKRGGFPSELRKAGIEWVVSKGVETIMFADADDYFADNRIEVSKEVLGDYDIVCNEMLLVGQDISQPIPMLEKFFEDKMEINKSHIATGNCMGLTNTALRAGIIPCSVASIPNSIIAFDWALFALCIHSGARTVFTKETETYYRQHTKNTASVQCFSEGQIMRGVEVKRDHYQLLSKFYKEYIPLASLFEDLLCQLRNCEELRQKYCKAVEQHISGVPMWWEPIKPLKEVGL